MTSLAEGIRAQVMKNAKRTAHLPRVWSPRTNTAVELDPVPSFFSHSLTGLEVLKCFLLAIFWGLKTEPQDRVLSRLHGIISDPDTKEASRSLGLHCAWTWAHTGSPSLSQGCIL